MIPLTAAPIDAVPSVAAEAFLGFDCRPLFRWVGCGPSYQHALRIFYAAFCALHAISTMAAMFYTVWTFCSCSRCGRVEHSRNRKTSLRVFTCFSLAAFSFLYLNAVSLAVGLYCFFLIDSKGYGVPVWLLAFLWGNSVNCLGSAAGLLILSWASALDERTMTVEKTFLGAYRRFFFCVLADRSLSTLLMVLSSLDIGGNSYLPVLRLFCAHWAAYALGLAVSMYYFGMRMRRRLIQMGATAATQRTTRIMVLYIGTASSCCVFACVQVGVQFIMENVGTLWLVMIGLFHTIITVLATWFIIGRPSDNELQRQASTQETKSQSGVSTYTTKYSLDDA